jgi:AcrR family transcriptional regulator
MGRIEVPIAWDAASPPNRRMLFSFQANDGVNMSAEQVIELEAPAWQARALQRSLEPARARSVERMERCVRAARDLANETGSGTFTVPDVAARAGVSLKTFYRCFRGKDDLLLALLEDDSRIGAELIRESVDREQEPVARLREYVNALFRLVSLPGAAGYAGVLVHEHRRLTELRPDDLRIALAPMVDLLTELIARAQSRDVESSAGRDADTMFTLLVAAIHEVVARDADPDELASYLWQFCWTGLRGDGVP